MNGIYKKCKINKKLKQRNFFETRNECILSILKQLSIKCEQIINYIKYI